MNPVILRKSHFNGGNITLLSDGAISNGHWAIRPSVVKNSPAFTTPETATAALGLPARSIRHSFETITPGGETHAWAATRFVYAHGRVEARIFQSTKTGEFTGIDRRILAVAGLDEPYTTVFGKDSKSPFMDAETREASAFIAMPFKIEPFPTEESN